MTALPTSGGLDWARIAQALSAAGAGLAASGAPSPYRGGGWANFGPAFQQSMQGFQSQAQDRERIQLAREQAERQRTAFEDERRERERQRAEQDTLDKAYRAMLGYGPTAGTADEGIPPMSGPGHGQRGQVLDDLSNYGPDGGVPRNAGFSGAQFGGGQSAPSQGASPFADIIAGMTPQQRAWLSAAGRETGMDILGQQMFQKPTGPQSALGKLRADLDAGMIDRTTYDALVKKETAGPQGPGLTERQRNALAAGLQPGTPEYEQYILGRDDNEGGGPFEGNAMDAQASNILLTGNPASPEYAAAYAHLAQPKVTFDPTTQKLVTVSPDLSWAAKPGQSRGALAGNAPQVPMLPGATGNRPGPTVQNAQAMPQQSQSGMSGAESFSVPGATVTSTPGTGLSAADRSKIRQIRADAGSIKSALTRFKEVVKSSDWRDDLSAYGGGMTEGGRRLNSTYNSAALLTKAESLFNLGVLNGPDLELIRRTLPDPSTLPGLLTSESASGVAVDEIISLIDNRLAAFESQFGGDTAVTPPPGGSGGGAPSGGTRVDQLPAGNWQ
jgi:hypothetical protein